MERRGDSLIKVLREQKGMMTVESAAIVPVISFAVVGIVFLLLFFIDMSVAKSESMRIASETAAVWKTSGDLVTGEYESGQLLSRNIYFLMRGDRKDLEGKAEQRLTKRIRERLLITRLSQSTVTINLQKVTVDVELIFRWPLRSVEEIMGELTSFSCTSISPTDNWEEQLRLGAGIGWK